MYFSAVVGTIFILTIDIVVVRNQRPFYRGNERENSSPEEEGTNGESVHLVLGDTIDNHPREVSGSMQEDNTDPNDYYTFVALVDVVFTDGTKRTCTGTIIHDNVVVTVAHCFVMEQEKSVESELTASFVVIGTKKMFDTGYEQYLPIERIITHPRYDGWTADLALVYTFAGMMSDKPGRVVALAREKSSQGDSNITVFSWGRCRKYKRRHKRRRKKANRVTQPLWFPQKRVYESDDTSGLQSSTEPYDYFEQEENNARESKQLSSFEATNYDENNTTETEEDEGNSAFTNQSEIMFKPIKKLDLNKKKSSGPLSYYRNNWRRTMGSQQNKLSVQVFTVMRSSSCKKFLDKVAQYNYKADNPNEFICYKSDDDHITKEDAGAPAMQRGKLMGITITAVYCDGENVAVALKASCFCSWIEKKLPGKVDLHCGQSSCGNNGPDNHKKIGRQGIAIGKAKRNE